MAPSHYLKQCGLIIKLINKVPWHLYQWIIIKDLKIPISKMRLKLVLWDNFTSSPEIIHLILFSSDNSFVLCRGGKLIFIVTIFNPSDCCLLKGNKVPSSLLWSQQDFEWRWSVPLFKCLTVLEFSFILFDLCLLITFFNFIMNYVPIVTFWIFTYHKIWILSIMFCFIWSYWIIYFLACLEVSWRVVS